MKERISFEEAISDEKLLKNHFTKELSLPQQVALKAFYGLSLNASELEQWAMFQGAAEFDELGYPTKYFPYPYSPKEYDKMVAILGRRSGKTDRITSTALAYEAVLGGHKQHVSPTQDFITFFVAQDVATATSHLKFVLQVLNSSPMMAKQIEKENSDGIYLRNGLSILPQPPTIKSSRGYAIPVVVMDEVGFWYKDAKSANPDFEVEIAVAYAQMQFPHAKEFVTSTPWTEEGILWAAQQAGTEGVRIRCHECTENSRQFCPHLREQREEHDGMLVLNAPTAAMGNPKITRKKLARERRRNPEAFKRESLAKFTKSSSGFLPEDFVKAAIDTGVYSRQKFPRHNHPEDPSPIYIASMDPAFRHDAFTFTIVHHDPTVGIVQDRLLRLLPGEDKKPINPAEALDQIQLLLQEFGLSFVYSDQYQLESLQQLALLRQFSIIGEDFTGKSKPKIYGSLEMLIKQKRIKLLDHPEIFDELVRLEKKRTPNGTMQIAAPNGKYDDVASVLAMAAYKSIWMLTPQVAKSKDEPKLEADHVKLGLEQIQRTRAELQEWAFGHEDD